jgi:hypothetical protein
MNANGEKCQHIFLNCRHGATYSIGSLRRQSTGLQRLSRSTAMTMTMLCRRLDARQALERIECRREPAYKPDRLRFHSSDMINEPTYSVWRDGG